MTLVQRRGVGVSPEGVGLKGERLAIESAWISGKEKGGGAEPPNRILKNPMALLAPKKGFALLGRTKRWQLGVRGGA
jgi:hypothetical protein